MVSLFINHGANVLADTIDTSGQAPYEQCGYCHEYDGNSVMPGFPKLAGQNQAYIDKQLRDFRAGRRTGTMQATAELLDDEAIAAVTAYFSQQHLRINKQFDDEATATGRRLFFEGDRQRDIASCSSCHGDNALGAGTVPRLAGQHAEYLEQEIKRFASRERQNDPGAIMQHAVVKLKTSEIQSLAKFLASGLGASATK